MLVFYIALFTPAIFAMPRLSAKSDPAFVEKEFPVMRGDGKTQNSFLNDDDAFFIFRSLGGFKNVDLDGVTSSHPKTESDLEEDPSIVPVPEWAVVPQMPFDGIKEDGVKMEDVMAQQPGVAPKFTGSFLIDEPTKAVPKGEPIDSSEIKDLDPDYIDAPVSNPAAYFLEGADLTKVTAPKCQLIDCTGPHLNDGSVDTAMPKGHSNDACHQTFVPLNGCTDGKGYPMGMLCQICCDCSRSFVDEFVKSRGYRTGYVEPQH